MILLHFNCIYGIDVDDYEDRIKNTFAWLKENVGEIINSSHSFILGDGWQMNLLGASGFTGDQIQLLFIYDERKEFLFRLSFDYGIINGVEKHHIINLMQQQQKRLIDKQNGT